ncbi:meiosis initiator protein-like [Chanodichthys erythropterus]|uniref:meiosis initiator protein-like n=1 Tax=Chanodichthys erythropterus TaxID=933992 RepID=UPI00351E92F9
MIKHCVVGSVLCPQETLINMLQCFDFHQSHIHSLKSHVPPHCIPKSNEKSKFLYYLCSIPGFYAFVLKDGRGHVIQTNVHGLCVSAESENEDTPLSSTHPQFLKGKKMYTYSGINKYTVRLRDPQSKDSERFIINAVEEQEHQLVSDGQSNSSEVETAEDKESWSVDDSQPSQSSTDSNSTTSSYNTGSTETEYTCSICEDQTGSEDGSPGRKVLDTPPSGSGILLKDPMLGAFPAAWKKHFPFRHTLTKTPILPVRSPPPRETDSLILNPSLLTSPSQGLSRSLHPEGREALQTLFEDVWVTPESTILKSPSLQSSFGNDSETVMSPGNSSYLYLKSEEGNKSSEDEMPEQLIPLKRARKGYTHRRTSRAGRVTTQPNPKKKCVNGFIMFCRMNRKLYIRSYPGIPSTTVTKELANLWHILPKRERRLYCLKAWSFSCQQNRNVRIQAHKAEIKAECSVPSPLHMLLAYREVYEAVQ